MATIIHIATSGITDALGSLLTAVLSCVSDQCPMLPSSFLPLHGPATKHQIKNPITPVTKSPPIIHFKLLDFDSLPLDTALDVFEDVFELIYIVIRKLL